MTEKLFESFVYCWTDHKTNRLYVGSHKGLENDGYICSSKLMLEQYELRPQDFSRQIIARGKDEDIRILEKKILISVDARRNKMFYNMHNGNHNFVLKQCTQTHKEKISKALLGKKKSKSHCESLKKSRQFQVMPKWTAERREKVLKSRHNYSHSELTKNKMKEGWALRRGKPTARRGRSSTHIISDETRKKLSDAVKLSWNKRRKN